MMGGLVSGLIDAYVSGTWVDRIDEIGVLVGDVGFFTGMPRTATCGRLPSFAPLLNVCAG